MEVNGQFHTPTALSAVPIRLETGWASELVWTQWWGETIPPPARNSGLAAHILVSVLTVLPRLRLRQRTDDSITSES